MKNTLDHNDQTALLNVGASTATSPEVSGLVVVGLDGKARLTPDQVEQLARQRFTPAKPQDGCPMAAALDLAHLGVIVRIKSHNARRNAGSFAALRPLVSIKACLYGTRRVAADGFYSVTPIEADRLLKATGRWMASISFPKRVPADLDFNRGGIFG